MSNQSWQQFGAHLFQADSLGLQLDLSRMLFSEQALATLAPNMAQAFAMMQELEAGAIANPDEGRMVGHYWLRAPNMAPTAEIRTAIESAAKQVQEFAAAIHQGLITNSAGQRFTHVLLIGIGGSALGPQFVAEALSRPGVDPMAISFFDNTDPDGMNKTLQAIGKGLGQTLVLVVSKSGSTAETRNGMLIAQAAYEQAGLSFAKCAVAITAEGSRLHTTAVEHGWLATFPMWDWVGGRTSVMSAVGLLPAALQGVDTSSFLEGARLCDALTRTSDVHKNPAALLAAAWYLATEGKGKKDMVMLPYSDRLLLFSRYLQQLIMESLGKEKDLDGKVVHQGISVYGNKGSTDQHAYVQQLREGVGNFFVTFMDVLEKPHDTLEVEPGITAGDYLRGFLLGTRQALFEAERPSMTLTVRRLDAHTLGALIALYERAVGLYAGLVNINAYHQPGVEAGKKAAAEVLALQTKIMQVLQQSGQALTAHEVASAAAAEGAAGVAGFDPVETAFHVLQGLAANGRAKQQGSAPLKARFNAVV